MEHLREQWRMGSAEEPLSGGGAIGAFQIGNYRLPN
jgi:hypothetical protein